jgi:hypothetical protein
MRCQAFVVAFGLVSWGLCLPTIRDTGGLSNVQLNPVINSQDKEDKLGLKNSVTLKWGNGTRFKC